MIRLSKESRLGAVTVLDRARRFLGESLGLEIAGRALCTIRLAGGGGHVRVTVTEGDRTYVDLERRAWGRQAKRFLRRLA